MALLTADDILNKTFTTTKFREGYDIVEVDDFLDEVLNTLRVMQGENEDLKGKVAAAERRVAELTRQNAAQAQAAAEQQQQQQQQQQPAGATQPGHGAPQQNLGAAQQSHGGAQQNLGAGQQPGHGLANQGASEQPAEQPQQRSQQAAATANQRMSEPESATGMLQLAQKLHDDYVRAGQEEGDRLVSEARTEGERIVREAQDTSARTLGALEQERSVLERKIDELRQFERDYRTRLQSYLENLLGDLNNRGATAGEAGMSGRSI